MSPDEPRIAVLHDGTEVLVVDRHTVLVEENIEAIVYFVTSHGTSIGAELVTDIREASYCQYCQEPVVDDGVTALFYTSSSQTDHLSCVPRSELEG